MIVARMVVTVNPVEDGLDLDCVIPLGIGVVLGPVGTAAIGRE